ncbi:HCL503Wp [Eremothecium sinecaudum]|uniref:HCL503Wp n=1 Tax=Eremothecium sinecaudum TaxID=45286 RepID=A0A109UY26_9SACH|nr:HCL503Wp [Eremothecium sinecaudum]AMD19648.1 HCL503Wp [Eremothecium sinecaudum]
MLQFERSIAIPRGDNLFTSSKISPNGDFVAICDNVTIYVVEFSSGKIQRLLTTHSEPINDICWSPDSQCVASASEDFTIEITHLEYGKIHTLTGHIAPVLALVYNCKGNLLCSSSMDESIKEWDVLTGTILKTMSAHSDPVVSIDIPQCDPTILSSGSYDGLIRIFDTKTGHCLKTLTYDKDWKTDDGVVPISQVKFSKNGKFLLVSSLDGVVKIWDYLRGCVVRTFKLHDEPRKLKHSCGIDFLYPEDSPEQLVVVGNEDGTIACWNAQSKILEQEIEGYHQGGPVLSISCYKSTVCTMSLDGECNLWRWHK